MWYKNKSYFDNFDTAHYAHHTHIHTYIHTYRVDRHTYRQTDKQCCLTWIWRREVVSSPHSYHQDWGCDCFPLFSLLLNVTISDISSHNQWTVLLVLLHLLTRLSEQWSHNMNYDYKKSHHVMNNVYCTTTAHQKLKLCDWKITECVTITTAVLVKNQTWKWQ